MNRTICTTLDTTNEFKLAFSSCSCANIGCRESHPLLNIPPRGFSFVGTKTQTRNDTRRKDIGPFQGFDVLTAPTFFRPLQVVTIIPDRNKVKTYPIFSKVEEIRTRWNELIDLAIRNYHKKGCRVGELHDISGICETITAGKQVQKIILLLPPPTGEGDDAAIVGSPENQKITSVFTIPCKSIPKATEDTQRKDFKTMKFILDSLKF